jgi:tetratricopeptide (TPR) repeat protein
VRSTLLRRNRRDFFLALKLIISLLFVVSGSFVVLHIISISGGAKLQLTERQQGLSDAGSGECADAINLLSSVIAHDPHDLVSKEALAGCYVSLDNFTSALSLLQDVAASEPNLPNELGVARVAFFDGDSALVQSALKIALVRAATADDFLSIADAASSYGLNSIAAVSLYRTQSAQRTYIWYDTDAQIQLDLGNPSIAVSAALRATRLSPHSTRASTLVDLGNTYVGASEYATAAIAFRGAISMHQQIDDASVYSQLSQCYIDMGRFLKAIASAKSGLANSPGADLYGLELSEATALADLHQSQGAIKILSAIIKAKFAPANVVASASALLSAIDD